MGIFGLSTFISSNAYAKRYTLQDCLAVADGPNLLYSIFQDIPFSDIEHSGNYANISNRFTQFFGRFKLANITLVILMDGYAEPNSPKAPTTLSRLNERVQFVKNKKKPNYGIIPVFSRKLFVKTAQESGAFVIQCVDEADARMMTLANALKCPVISKDGDFYVYNLEFGFIPLDAVDLSGQGGISCTLYKTAYLLADFPKLHLETLPILAVLAGNDYSAPIAWTNFIHHVPAVEHNLVAGHKQAEMLIRFLSFLQGKSFDDAAAGILRSIGAAERARVREAMEHSRAAYGYAEQQGRFDPPKGSTPENIVSSFSKFLCDEALSNYIDNIEYLLRLVVNVVSPFLDHSLLQVAICKQVYLDVQVEDFSLPSIHDANAIIRHALFALVTKETCIEEFKPQRNGQNDVTYASRRVDLKRIHSVHIESLAVSSSDEQLNLLRRIIVDLCPLAKPPAPCEDLFMFSAYIWSQSPYVLKCHIFSLLVGVILTHEESRNVIALLNIDSFDVSIKSRLKCVHVLNAWQMIYSQLLCLNSLSGSCMDFPDPTFFNGRLCFSISADLKFSNDTHGCWSRLRRQFTKILTTKRLDEVVMVFWQQLSKLGIFLRTEAKLTNVKNPQKTAPQKSRSSRGSGSDAAESSKTRKYSSQFFGSNKFAVLDDD